MAFRHLAVRFSLRSIDARKTITESCQGQLNLAPFPQRGYGAWPSCLFLCKEIGCKADKDDGEDLLEILGGDMLNKPGTYLGTDNTA
jgi:hypothetical protein